MTQFEFLTVALSFVLGLAVTVILTSLLTAFRARRKTRMSWLPFAWATYVLVIQFDVWWELYGLVSIERWSVVAFILLLLLALQLFAAGGLVLPRGSGDYPADLAEYFQEDGRWGVAVVGVFEVTAIVVNIVLFDIPVFGGMNIWNAVGVGIIALLICSRRRRAQGAATIAFGAWLGGYLWMFVPGNF